MTRAFGFFCKRFATRLMTKVCLALAEISLGSVKSSAKQSECVKYYASCSGSE